MFWLEGQLLLVLTDSGKNKTPHERGVSGDIAIHDDAFKSLLKTGRFKTLNTMCRRSRSGYSAADG